jgi:aspartate kinase
MIVMKFGGSSIKDATMITNVAKIITARLDEKPAVVLSAVKGITDLLILSLEESTHGKYDAYAKIYSKHKEILKDLGLDTTLVDDELNELKRVLEANTTIKEHGLRMLDYISFFGERMSTKVMAAFLVKQGVKAKAFESGDLGLITNSAFGDARILKSSFSMMKEKVSALDVLPLITGFGGKNKEGEYTTFARGGSDYVASLFGVALECKEIQIWTDVNGIMSADPRIVADAKSIKELSFDEASELAFFGAKVLHPKTILPAIKADIPVVVLNTYEPEHPGSRIVREVNCTQCPVKAISYKKGITLVEAKSTRMIDAHGYLARMFQVFERHCIPVDMIATSEVNVTMTVNGGAHLECIVHELKEIAHVRTIPGMAIIYVVGEGIRPSKGLAGRIFSILEDEGVTLQMISLCYEKVSIGFVVEEKDAEKVVKVLHGNLVR